MNTQSPARSKARPHPKAMTIMWAALLLILASSWVSSVPAQAHTVLSLPAILPTSIVAPPSGLVAIHGEGFSPGGLVNIAVYDRSGVNMRQHVWTVAATAVYGPNGSADPAQGFANVGTVSKLISLFPDVVYGPNGSQDPAQGYVNAARVPGENASACGQDLIVRGYDARTSTWNNPVDVVTSC